MSRIRRILVAIKDPWARSHPAIKKAAQLARTLGARIELLHALSNPIYADVAEFADETLSKLEHNEFARAAARLKVLAIRLEKTGLRVQTTIEWDFPPHEAVIRAARRSGADLIVAECHPTRHHIAWAMRLTDFELLRLAPIPVLLVKTARGYNHPSVLAAVDPQHAYSKPLKLDHEILNCATQFTHALRGSLHAVFAYDPLPARALEPELALAGATETISAETAARASNTLTRALNGATIPKARRHVVPQPPIDAIKNTALDIGCNLLVMGGVSRSGFRRLVLGNTAERLFDELQCDVLVIKPKQLANRVPRARWGAQLMTFPVVEPVA
jgi:universal stress protein E